MAQYLGTVKLGGFYNNGAILKRPTRPWRNDSTPPGASDYGDIPSMSGSMANYTFGDTPSADANKLQWVKIKDGDKTLLTPDVLIDDRPVTLEAMAAKGVTVLHPDHAYCTAAPGRMFHRWAAVPLILGGVR